MIEYCKECINYLELSITEGQCKHTKKKPYPIVKPIHWCEYFKKKKNKKINPEMQD